MTLSDAFAAVVKATTDDLSGHLPNCGYTDEKQTCGCAEWGKRLHESLREVLIAAKREGWHAAQQSALVFPLRPEDCPWEGA